MSYKVTLNAKECLKMDPIELADLMSAEMVFDIPEEVETKEGNIRAGNTITKATAYASYCTEMETKAKLLKRAAKAEKNKEEADRYLGIEDVFKACKEISKANVENVAKLMTLRRLDLEEQKQNVFKYLKKR
jgi:hypothetical protein